MVRPRSHARVRHAAPQTDDRAGRSTPVRPVPTAPPRARVRAALRRSLPTPLAPPPPSARSPRDSIIAAWQVGPLGRVIGLDLNPTMCRKAEAHAAASGVRMACHEGRMEDIPLPDASVDVVISNGVINLSFRKRRVIHELFRVLKPARRLSITDIASAKQLSQSIVNDPKLWAS